jgi:N-methylhydantoinase B
MAATRGAVKLFDRGFESIAELKGRCLAETGLPPPTQPVFTPWARAKARLA